jgi:hypothetical protein
MLYQFCANFPHAPNLERLSAWYVRKHSRVSIQLTSFHRSFLLQRQYTLDSLSYSLYVLSFPVVHLCNIQLYQAIKGVKDSHDALVELLESIEHLLYRLDIYTKITPTVAMTEMLIKILVELLSTLALMTKEVRQGKPSEFVFTVVTYITGLNIIQRNLSGSC